MSHHEPFSRPGAATPAGVEPALHAKHLRRIGASLVVSAAVILFIGQFTDIDVWLADLYFDPAAGVFPWDRTWFGRDLMHGYVKNVIMWIGFLLILTVLADLLFPFRRLSPRRRAQLRFLALAALFEPMLVTSLKAYSNLQCPFRVDLYGGSQPLLRLFDAVPEGWRPGRCFPAAHASAGMWLSALGVLFLPCNPRRAFAVFCGGLAFGLFMGWVQQMRGMHFLTHTLATAWISTALLTTLLVVLWKPLHLARTRRPAARAA